MESSPSDGHSAETSGDGSALFPQRQAASSFTDISGRVAYATKGDAPKSSKDDHEKSLLRRQLKMEKACNGLLSERIEALADEMAVVQRRNEELEQRYQERMDCSICFTEELAVIFHCGHSACRSCAEKLPNCHVCRKDLRVFTPIYYTK